MKARISYYNAGVGKNLLKRCWPLWLCYSIALILLLPVGLSSRVRLYAGSPELTENLMQTALNGGAELALLSFFTCIVAAMLMYGYLYDAKSCGMMNALPLRRETLFSTAFLTGLVPLFIADILAFLIAAAFFGGYGCMWALWIWLLMALLCNLCFYGISAFCAVLTGSMMILPALYAVLNFAAYLATNAVQALLRLFVYGFYVSASVFEKFSPLYGLLSELFPAYDSLPSGDGQLHMGGLGLLGIYAAAGLALAVAALFIYRKRRMETASDVVAIPVLKPIFKYCLCFGSALVFSSVIYHSFFDTVLTGFASAALALALMLIGAFIGYFAAEMLMQKTVRVFSGKWKGYIVSCCILAVFTLVFELDVFGYERYVPNAEQVQSVTISFDGAASLKEPENIALATQLHRSVVGDKSKNEGGEEVLSFDLTYYLKNGQAVSRRYMLAGDAEAMASADSNIALLEKAVNVQEAIEQRTAISIPFIARNVSYSEIFLYYSDENGEYKSYNLELEAAEAESLYKQCILPDINDGTLGLRYVAGSAAHYENASNASINIELHGGGSFESMRYDYLSLNVTLGARRTCAWLEEHCGENFMSIVDAEKYAPTEDDIYAEKYFGATVG